MKKICTVFECQSRYQSGCQFVSHFRLFGMSDNGSSVTLIFYRIGSDWYRGGEPLLNLIAAAAQGSVFTHVEVAIGEVAGEGGRMSNVLRVFNDQIGTVKTAIRTTRATCTIYPLPP